MEAVEKEICDKRMEEWEKCEAVMEEQKVKKEKEEEEDEEEKKAKKTAMIQATMESVEAVERKILEKMWKPEDPRE